MAIDTLEPTVPARAPIPGHTALARQNKQKYKISVDIIDHDDQSHPALHQ